MRLRNDPNASVIVNENPLYIDFNENKKINWLSIFNDNPLYVEIGSGKGDFIIKNALNNESINFIGIEKNLVVCSKIFKKINKLDSILKNLRIMNCDAKDLVTIFNDKKIDKIFLNFSDPWPKKRHHKYRLTHPKFLSIYKDVLNHNGVIELKTDNDNFYYWSLEQIEENGWDIIYTTNDLYSELNNVYNHDNIQTEYEKKFLLKNIKIKKIIFTHRLLQS